MASDMTAYPADAIEHFKNVYRRSVAFATGNKRPEALNEYALEQALAAFDAAMLAHGWKRVRVYTQADLDAAEREAAHLLAVFETDATPEVKP